MVGQDTLVEQFNTFTLNTLPHTMMFVGPFGCGKHTFCNELASKFNLQLIDIATVETIKVNKISADDIENIVNPTLLLLYADNIIGNNSGAILKLLEEPPKHIFIAVLLESTSNIIDTILNRCHIYRFSTYTEDILKAYYTANENLNHYQLALQVANTPGKMLAWSPAPLVDIYNYCYKIFDKIISANAANLFNIIDRIEFSDEATTKYDINLFSELLLYCAKQRVIENKELATLQYNLTTDFVSKLNIPNINKQQLFENYLYRLKQVE